MNQPQHLFNRLKRFGLSLSLSFAAVAGAAGHATAQEINFGIIATDSANVQRERWEPFFADMAKKTGLTIKSFMRLTMPA